MKLFDEWLDTHEQSYSSNPKVWMEEAFRAGMLAAADIVIEMIADDKRPQMYEHMEYANKIRQAAK